MTTWQEEPPTSRRALRERERAQSQEQGGTPQAPSPGFRVRDYSPEGRGSQFSTVAPLDAASRPPASASPPTPEPVAAEPVERTLTRRELRALRETAEQNPAVEPPPSQEWGAAPRVSPELPLPPSMHESPAPNAAPTYAPPLRAEHEELAAPPELVDPLGEYPTWQQAGPAPLPPVPGQFDRPAPEPAPQQFVQSEPAPQEGWAREPEPAPDVVVVPEAAYAPPAPEFELPPTVGGGSPERPEGHWSRQADLDDKTQLGDIRPGRDLSRSDAITTSALVLPSMPSYQIGPLSSTGEILVTGSIDLPRMLGATGVHPARFDHADVDSIIDASDREDPHPSSSPVRAIRAVSTHTSTQGIIASKRPRSKMPTYILAGVATVMGAGVVVLFVGGMLLDVF